MEKTYTIGQDVHTLAVAATAAVYHHLYDGHGSTRALLNAAGNVVEKYAYDAYGNLQQLTGYMAAVDQALTSLLYSGEQTDRTGMQYLRARYYDPRSGRFNRLDPFVGSTYEPRSLHKYLYAFANPIYLIDPSGLVPSGFENVGHHWIPVEVIGRLEGQGLISYQEKLYLLGRSSGPLSELHVNDAAHRGYTKAVLDQARMWVENNKQPPIEIFVDNIRAGKSFDGARQITEIYEFNARTIAGDVLKPRYDVAAEEEILRRGRIASRLRPTKLLLFIGIVGGAAEIANAASQANDISTILTQGEGIRDAIKFAKEGREASLREALIGVGGRRQSTFEELLGVNRIFALAYRKSVEINLALQLPDD